MARCVTHGKEATGMISDARAQPLGRASELQRAALETRTVFEATTDGMLVIGALPGQRPYTIVDVNHELSAMTGFRPDELIGVNPLRLVHPADRRRVAAASAAIQSQERFAATVTVVRKDGSTLDAELQTSPLHYRDFQHHLVVVRDIAERMQAFRMLEQRIAERTHELETLLAVAQSVASTLELPALLSLVLDQLKTVVDHDGAAIMLREDDEIRIVEARDYRTDVPQADLEMAGLRFPADRAGRIWETLSRREPVIIGDVRGDEPLASEYRATVGAALTTTFGGVRSYLAIPLASREGVFGFVRLSWTRPHAFTPRHAELATAFAHQVAIAFENARLFDLAQQHAAIEERQRLARELHDSVSQALYGIGLGAQTALAIVEREPGKVIEPVRYILELANTGLAEMRALIFELRPESLEHEGLVRAIEKQAIALGARHRIAIEPAFDSEPDIPLPIKEALYRIAQEAMHNAVKHARPRTIRLRLDCGAGMVTLEVADDGTGFDTSGSFPGHLGLKSMPERAERLGGQVVVTSTPGAGTRVCASIPVSQQH
jgi:PAS domain S-box-containing protein